MKGYNIKYAKIISSDKSHVTFSYVKLNNLDIYGRVPTSHASVAYIIRSFVDNITSLLKGHYSMHVDINYLHVAIWYSVLYNFQGYLIYLATRFRLI